MSSKESNDFVPKPPLGLTPEWVIKQERLDNVTDAMWRYIEARKVVPLGWYEEMNSLIGWLNENKKEKPSLEVKDWEIVSFEGGAGLVISKNYSNKAPNKNKPFTVLGTLWMSEEECMELHSIHSVRRKEDGTIWVVGQEVGSKHFSKSTIKGFYIKGNEMMVDFENNDADCNIYWLTLIPVKQAIFVTEDGVEISNINEYVFGLSLLNWSESTVMIYYKPLMSGEWKWFSSEEKRNDYVLLNKPCLSISEVGGILSGKITSHIAEQLKELAKQKIDSK